MGHCHGTLGYPDGVRALSGPMDVFLHGTFQFNFNQISDLEISCYKGLHWEAFPTPPSLKGLLPRLPCYISQLFQLSYERSDNLSPHLFAIVPCSMHLQSKVCSLLNGNKWPWMPGSTQTDAQQLAAHERGCLWYRLGMSKHEGREYGITHGNLGGYSIFHILDFNDCRIGAVASIFVPVSSCPAILFYF